MAIPSNLIVTPDLILNTNLPTQITISGTDIFERPSYTGRELFDVIDSRWKGGATQGQGIIGKSIVLNGSSSYYEVPVIESLTDFYGFGVWFKTSQASGTRGVIASVSESTTGFQSMAYIGNGAAYGGNGAITVQMYCLNGGSSAFKRVRTNLTGLNDGNWHYLFTYLDLSVGTNAIQVEIDGVSRSTTILNNQTATSFRNDYDNFYLGARTTPTDFLNGELCGFYKSTNPDFKFEGLKYANLPDVVVNSVDVTSSVTYTSETEITYTAPDTLPAGTINGSITNSSGYDFFSFFVESESVPNNLVVTPDPILDSSLPTTISISGAAIFERLSRTFNEDFQVVDSKWKGGALQGQGVVGKSLIGNGVDACILYDSNIPVPTTFFGVSLRFKVTNGTRATTQRMFSLSNNTELGAFDIAIRTDGRIRSTAFGLAGTTAVRKSVDSVETFSNDGLWHHLFIYLDLSSPTNIQRIWVDNTELTLTINDNDSFSNLNDSQKMTIGCEYYNNSITQFFSGDICDFSLSTNPDFKKHIAKYANLPDVAVNSVDVTSSVTYTSETEITYTAPDTLPSGTINGSVTNVTGAGTFNFEILRTNTAPTDISLSPSSVNENQPIGTTVGTLSSTDSDIGDTFTYTLVAGTGSDDNADFTIAGDQLLTASIFNYETKASYSIRVRSTDSGSLYFEKALTVTINDIEDSAPIDILLDNTNVDEGKDVGEVVGNLSAVDVDLGDTHTFTLVSGIGDNHNSDFQISGTELQTAVVLDYDLRTYSLIRIRATDVDGLYYEKQFRIDTNQINDAPTDITLSNTDIDEKQPIGTDIGVFTTIDPNYWDTHTYTLVSGTGDTDNTSFTIGGDNNDTLLSAEEFDHEIQSVYSIRVKTTDPASNEFEKVFTITINDVDEGTPTLISLSPSSVTEGVSNGTIVGQLTVTDVDTADIHSFELPDDAEGRFDVLYQSDSFDGESVNTVTNTITIKNDITRFSIGDVVEITGGSILPTGLLRNTRYVIKGISSNDITLYESDGVTDVVIPEVGSGLFYLINKSVANITVKDTTLIDYESSSSHDITVEATDSGLNTYSEIITIAVLDSSSLTARILSITPFASQTGTYPEIVISGQNFVEGGAPTVRIDGIAATLTSYSDTEIRFVLTDDLAAGVHTLSVVNGAGL
jgi:hypothetical protein